MPHSFYDLSPREVFERTRKVHDLMAAPGEFFSETEPNFFYRASEQRWNREKRALNNRDSHSLQAVETGRAIKLESSFARFFATWETSNR